MKQWSQWITPALPFALPASLALPGHAAASAARFFTSTDLMKIGTYDYPEHWPPEKRGRNFAWEAAAQAGGRSARDRVPVSFGPCSQFESRWSVSAHSTRSRIRR
jgi:hypothetical protein